MHHNFLYTEPLPSSSPCGLTVQRPRDRGDRASLRQTPGVGRRRPPSSASCPAGRAASAASLGTIIYDARLLGGLPPCLHQVIQRALETWPRLRSCGYGISVLVRLGLRSCHFKSSEELCGRNTCTSSSKEHIVCLFLMTVCDCVVKASQRAGAFLEFSSWKNCLLGAHHFDGVRLQIFAQLSSVGRQQSHLVAPKTKASMRICHTLSIGGAATLRAPRLPD